MHADDEQLATELYDIRKLFRGDWYTTVLAMLRHGPRRPAELDAATDHWAFYDRWTQTTRRIGHAQIAEALHALTAMGLVERRELAGGFQRYVEYSLTLEGEECLPAFDHLRHWLRRHPTVLNRAVRHYHHTHGHRREFPA